MAVYTINTTPKSITDPVKITVNKFHINDIPGAMDNMGWHVASKLMNHWFFIEPDYVMDYDLRHGNYKAMSLDSKFFNDDIVKIDWLLSYKTWQAASLTIHQTWNTPNGVSRLIKLLKEAGWYKGKKTSTYLGSTSFSARECEDTCQINFTNVGSLVDRLDDLYGAIGKGTLKLAVSGKTINHNGRDIFHVEYTGIYLRDTYDFSGDDEPLGIWSKQRILDKFETAIYKLDPFKSDFSGFVPVYNRDFRRWQNKNHSGGDFIVYSDVKWTKQVNLYVEL